MKAVTFALLAALTACKSESKPAAKEAPAAEQGAPAARAPHARPELPSDEDDTAAPSLPAGDRRRQIDTDGDGVISPEEREAARAARAQRMEQRLQERLDANHDGKVTTDELAAAGSAHNGPRFADPKAVDTNNDGVISPDELQAALAARRQQWRGGRHGDSGSAAAPVGDE